MSNQLRLLKTREREHMRVAKEINDRIQSELRVSRSFGRSSSCKFVIGGSYPLKDHLH